jgi:cytochrome c oxidase assembly protein subunit 15
MEGELKNILIEQQEKADYKARKQVAIWLLIGVGMIVIQVMLGGITRLTESGLSITEWKPVKGALPPLNDAAWQEAFEKYKQTDQFKYVHQHFSLSDFKFIFFWEWFHREWARLMGLVFLVCLFPGKKEI